MVRKYKLLGDYSPDCSIYRLILEDHIKYVDPAKYGLEIKGIDPTDYFITSGEAVAKARVLLKELREHYQEVKTGLHSKLSDNDEYCEGGVVDYLINLERCIQEAATLYDLLFEARANNCFLETEWDDNILYCLQKNPRRK